MKLISPIIVAAPPALLPFPPTNSASKRPDEPRKIPRYAPEFEGRGGRLETKSVLYVLAELQTERLEKPTVLRRRVPAVIAIDRGLVLPEPHFGHLNLSAAFVAILCLVPREHDYGAKCFVPNQNFVNVIENLP
jgi:hypothetical protein